MCILSLDITHQSLSCVQANVSQEKVGLLVGSASPLPLVGLGLERARVRARTRVRRTLSDTQRERCSRPRPLRRDSWQRERSWDETQSIDKCGGWRNPAAWSRERRRASCSNCVSNPSPSALRAGQDDGLQGFGRHRSAPSTSTTHPF